MGITVDGISKSYGGFAALRDVSLEIPDGELTALLGPSGSGKTTLLRIIAGLERPDAGSGAIRFQSEDMADRRVQDRRVGFVFQHYALFRHMTVAQNVAFGLEVRPRRLRPSRREIDAKVHELLKLVQLDGMSHRYPAQLSGGQRQRVALARALAVEPRVLLLDEPFGALDAKVRKELRAWLRRLHEEIQVTSVFVTHDQDEALEVADRVVVMNEGHIEQTGTPDEVFHRPATEFVVNFLGNVNVFHGRVAHGKVSFADMELDAPDHVDENAQARVFIRPHDLILDVVPPLRPNLQATVVNIHSAGPFARLELRAVTGETFSAEIPQDRYRELSIVQGSLVYASQRELRIFANNPAEELPR
jgi:sulfate transport system ATP-binding protein